jgi:DNA-binding NarL/FixJ family response regulator
LGPATQGAVDNQIVLVGESGLGRGLSGASDPCEKGRGTQAVTVRAVIQDQRRLFRDGLALLLEAEDDFDVVGSASTLTELAEVCDQERPHVALVQAGGAANDPIRVVNAVRRRSRHIRVIGLCSEMARRDVDSAMRAGFDAVLPQVSGFGQVLDVLRNAQPKTSAGRALMWLDTPPAAKQSTTSATLTEREREVLSAVGSGATTREISKQLGISAKTVENHKHRIFAKLDVHNQAHAVSVAMRAGLLTMGSGNRVASSL